jgi:hypothetical protein
MQSRNCKYLGIFRYKSWFYVLGALYVLLIVIEVIYRLELNIFVKGYNEKHSKAST